MRSRILSIQYYRGAKWFVIYTPGGIHVYAWFGGYMFPSYMSPRLRYGQ